MCIELSREKKIEFTVKLRHQCKTHRGVHTENTNFRCAIVSRNFHLPFLMNSLSLELDFETINICTFVSSKALIVNLHAEFG